MHGGSHAACGKRGRNGLTSLALWVWSAPVVTASMTTPDSKRIEPEDPSIIDTTVDELRPLYRQMLAIRRMEEASAKAYSNGKIGGFLHLIIGQEAVCVG